MLGGWGRLCMQLHVSTKEGVHSQTPESNSVRCRNGSNITSQLENSRYPSGHGRTLRQPSPGLMLAGGEAEAEGTQREYRRTERGAGGGPDDSQREAAETKRGARRRPRSPQPRFHFRLAKSDAPFLQTGQLPTCPGPPSCFYSSVLCA